jgi:hypothetical protein
MKANIYVVTKDSFLPFICMWVNKGDHLLVNKIFEKNALSMTDTLTLKGEGELEPKRSFMIVKQKHETKPEINEPKEIEDITPNKSMFNKRRKVRVK